MGRRMIRRAKFVESQTVDLQVDVRDFGPIASGQVSLRPLTLMIGPNNSGKSYAAMFLDALLKAHDPLSDPKDFLSDIVFPYPDRRRNPVARGLETRISDLRDGEALDVEWEVLSKIAETLVGLVYGGRLARLMRRSFQADPKNLCRAPRPIFDTTIVSTTHEVKVASSEQGLATRGLFLKEAGRFSCRFVRDNSLPVEEEVEYGGTRGEAVVFKFRGSFPETKGEALFGSRILMELYSNARTQLRRNIPSQAYYLAAARSGIVQSYQALVPAVIEEHADLTAAGRSVYRAPGAYYDFLSFLTRIPKAEGPFSQLADEFARECLKGSVDVKRVAEYGLPQITYSLAQAEVPLTRASSSVTELVPLLLYIKYEVKHGSVLTIEEPEAHLHPENQRLLAKFLVRLVRGGVNLVITTHSDYLLEQLNHFIMLDKVPREKRPKEYLHEDLFLKPEEIAAHVFCYDKRSKGYKIKQLEVIPETGISEEEFLRIYEVLYEELYSIESNIASQ